MSRLSCRGLDVRIGGVLVAKELDLDVQAGEFWALLGPNGIGKTTLLRCLAGLDEPLAGQVLLDTAPILSLPRKRLARQLGMLQQHTVYVFDSSVKQTVLTGRHPHLAYWSREGPDDHGKAERALASVDLADFAERSVTGLSGGEARRLAFATLLVQEPGLMLLDEPTNHLDLHHQLRIMRMIGERCTDGGRSAFCALHDVNLAARYCSHVLMLFGNGEWSAGAISDLLDESRLQRLYGCAVERVEGAKGPRFHPA